MIQELFLILQQHQQLLFVFNNLTIQPFNLSSLDSIIEINKNIYINRKWLYKHLNKEQPMLDLKKRILINGETKKENTKTEYPVSKSWLFVLLFLVCGGAILELIRLIF